MADVLLASTAPGGAASSSSAKMRRLTASCSGAASMTRSAPATAVREAARGPEQPEGNSLGIPRRSSPAEIRPGRASSAAGTGSYTATGTPAARNTWAMPAPIRPAPMTATRGPPPAPGPCRLAHAAV